MIFSVKSIDDNLGAIDWNNGDIEFPFFNSISIDSRKISSGDLFIAIKGKNFDGHNFINEVIEKGVKAIVVNREMKQLVPDNYPYWEVSNTLEAFQKLALYKKKKLNIPVVAITGSVGKTTTKEMIGEVLKKYGKFKISNENYNNEIGVALTILSSDEEDQGIVLEMGMRGLGQIENLSKFSEPDIAIITNIGTAHIGLLGSRENIAIAKCEITKYLNPDGVVVIPSGDYLLETKLKKNWKGRIVKVNLQEKGSADKLNDNDFDFIRGIYDKYQNNLEINNYNFKLSLRGAHNAFNFLFAYAVSREFGIKYNTNNEFNFKVLNGRNKLIKKDKAIVMDETYNSSPESIRACIEVLLQFPNKHFLVLGSIKELGHMNIKFHVEILNYINKININGCIFLCDSCEEKTLKNIVKNKDKIRFVNDINETTEILNNWINKGDCVLIKGSRYWQLEKIIPLIN